MSEGIARTTAVITRYQIIERLYLGASTGLPSSESQLLSDCLVKVYIIVLRYLVKLKMYWSHNTAVRIAKAVTMTLETEQDAFHFKYKEADEDTYRMLSLIQNHSRDDEARKLESILSDMQAENMAPVIRIAKDVSQLHD